MDTTSILIWIILWCEFSIFLGLYVGPMMKGN
jgi:hypothetical protein